MHLLSDVMYYRILTLHGIDMLIFWILFFEVAVIYFAVTSPLNSRLFSRKIAWVSLVLMVIGAVLTNVMILQGKGECSDDVLSAAYG